MPNLSHQYKDAVEKGDYYYKWKQAIAENPDCRAIVTLNGVLFNIQLIDPELVKEFLRQPELYEKRLGGGLVKMLLQDGLFSAEGAVWKRHRKIDSQAFHFDFITSQIPVIRNITKEFISAIRPEEGVIPIRFFQSITGEVVCRTFFGSNLSSKEFHGQKLHVAYSELMADIFKAMMSPMNVIFGKWYLKYFPDKRNRSIISRINQLKKICLEMVLERKESIKQQGRDGISVRHDLLDILLRYQGEHGGDSFNDDEIVHEFLTFFIAGLDTTGHTLNMATYYISRIPEVKQKILAEIKKVFGDKRELESITYEELNRLEYMQAVLNETLRMSTPAPTMVSRAAKRDSFVGDFPIPKKANVVVSFLINNFNTKYFEDPYEFRPERWINSEGKTISYHLKGPFIFIPFSAGPRVCIGQSMAIMQAKIILMEFMKTFDFDVPADYKLRMVRRFAYEPLDVIKLKPR